MVRKNRVYFIVAIAIMAALLVVSLIYLPADKTKLSTQEFANEISFFGTVGTLLVVALSLVAIGVSVKEADIVIEAPISEHEATSGGWSQRVEVRNKGNAMGNMAHVLVNIKAPSTSPISFKGGEGHTFVQTASQITKQYWLDIPDQPQNLYPGEHIRTLVGFIQVPFGSSGYIKFSVQVIGSQGRTKREFNVLV